KHAHHVADIDHEGTDTYRHRLAGAEQVILSSPLRWAKMTELRGVEEPSLQDLLGQMSDADIVLVEGYKSAPHPKIEAFRVENGRDPLANDNSSIVAIAGKGDFSTSLPVLGLDDTQSIADYILGQVGLSAIIDAAPKKLRNDCFALPAGVDWVPVDEALARLEASLTPVTGSEEILVDVSTGRVLAQDVIANRSNPPAANSAVDGYGFDHASVAKWPCRLPLVDGRAAAGVPFDGDVPTGQAIRILTGAIIPRGVDTVVLEEDVLIESGHVVFSGGLKRGSNTRRAGEDIEVGQPVLSAGHVIRPADIALLTAVGIKSIFVCMPLRVGVLSTGDEIKDVSDISLELHQIYDANRPMLLSLVERWGHQAIDMGLAPDDPNEIERRLNGYIGKVDVILTSGGASAGDEDHVSHLLSTKGTLSSWRIAMKPGRPLALAMWQGVPVFGLPGNPVAAFVCALVFGKPAMSLLSGAGWQKPQGFMVPAAFDKSKKHGRREYLRAKMNENGEVEAFKSEGSGRISGLAWAEGLVELPDEGCEIAKGDLVRYLPYASFGI
ncbi:MAG: molybdopterin-guanine dinucleotide biosynthesis protein B, partial [Paracoccaceae bacterium]|nr:molybdopterin-guanine dinucleotide biosynthesis protein B [Paracoccaceae bacterium]